MRFYGKAAALFAALLALALLAGCAAAPQAGSSAAPESAPPAAASSSSAPVSSSSAKPESSSKAPAAAASSSAPEAKEAEGVDWEDGNFCAVAFLGYGDVDELAEGEVFAALVRDHPGFGKTDSIPRAETKGDYVFAVLPRWPDARVSVREYTKDASGSNEIFGKTLYTGGGGPFFVRCDNDGAWPNARVTITRGSDTFDYQPYVDYQSGYLYLEIGDTGVQDVTPEIEHEGDYSAYEYAAVYTIGAVPQVSVDPDAAAQYFGFRPEAGPWPVTGTTGKCRRVFVGCVGQEVWPVALFLMDDGGVEYLEIAKAIRNNYDFTSQGRLALTDIAKFVSAEVSDGGAGGYTTIFAIDKGGVYHDISGAIYGG